MHLVYRLTMPIGEARGAVAQPDGARVAMVAAGCVCFAGRAQAKAGEREFKEDVLPHTTSFLNKTAGSAARRGF